MMNILNGGAHADTNVDIQEFMIAPVGARDLHRGAALGRRDLPRAEGGAPPARAEHRCRRRGRFRARPGHQPGRAGPDHRGDRQGRADPRPRRRTGHRRGVQQLLHRRRLRVRGRQAGPPGARQRLRALAGQLPDRVAGRPAGRGGLGRLARADRPARRPGAARRRRHLRDQPRAAAPRHRREERQRAAGQGQPDRHADRDAGRGGTGAPQRLPLHDEPPVRRDRGHHDLRPGGGGQLRAD